MQQIPKFITIVGRVVSRIALIRNWCPSKKFLENFLPTFWATILGAVLSIPSGLYLDRLIRLHIAKTKLPAICRELESSKVSLKIFMRLNNLPPDAVGPTTLRTIETSLSRTGFEAIDDVTLVKAISDAYSTMNEVNTYLASYKDAYTASSEEGRFNKAKAAQSLLIPTSREALDKVRYAIDAIKNKVGKCGL